ncbi:MAG: endonuclease domain-containing protein [Phycisphaerales bacterium]
MHRDRPKRHRLSPATTERARTLRHEAPIPERVLWSLLRGRRLADFKFRRQHPIGRYFADYCCPRIRLVIELDGMSHDTRVEYDQKRTQFMELLGYRVIRFTDDDLLQNPEAVALTILRELEILTGRPSP